jgi:hypothetical protein
LYYETFATGDAMSEEAEDDRKVKAALLGRFKAARDPETAVRDAVELSFVDSDVIEFVSKADSCCKEAGSNEEAKFGLLRKASRSNQTLMHLIILRSPMGYTELKKTIMDFEKAKDAFGRDDTDTSNPKIR